jgi:type I restriction enzyme M protein
MLKGVVSMPSNIFATTGTNVSVLFIDKDNRDGNVILMDASKLGTPVKDGKNQKTLLSPEEEELIINTFNDMGTKEDFTIIVSFDEIQNKNYSFSAGQYFDVKIKYIEITPSEFKYKIDSYKSELDKLFLESRKAEEEIKNQIKKLSYE